MSRVEVKSTKYDAYPESITVSIPVEEVPLPDVDAQIPPRTSHIGHTIYLETHNPRQEDRGFWEIQTSEHGPLGPVLSMEEYNDTVRELGVPPSPKRWTKEATLHVPRAKIITVVDIPPEGEQQIRGATIKRKKQSDNPPEQTYASLDDYVEGLEQHGFPERSFDHLRTGLGYSGRFKTPGIRSLATVVDRLVVAPMLNQTFASVREGNIANIVRANRQKRHDIK